MKSKALCWLNMLLIAAILILGYFGQSYFEIICAVCALMFGLVQIRLYFFLEKDESVQRKLCKHAGFFLALPAAGIVAAGILLPFRPYTSVSQEIAYGAAALSAVIVVSLSLQISVLITNSSVAGRFLKLANAAAMSAPASLSVVIILHVTQADEAAALGCMSTIICGGAALLIAANLIIVSFCGYKSTKDGVMTVSALIKSKQLVFTRVSILKDILLVAGKLTLSIISLSFFMFTNALYSTGMGIARFTAVKMYAQERKAQIISYRRVGIIISIASICYVLYSVRLFFGGKAGVYTMYIALVIALYTFIEFGINVREAFRLRKSTALEAKALRAISLSSTLLCFVLTQTAIMSFAAEGDNSYVNALAGVVFGGLAALIGVYVIIDSNLHKKGYEAL